MHNNIDLSWRLLLHNDLRGVWPFPLQKGYNRGNHGCPVPLHPNHPVLEKTRNTTRQLSTPNPNKDCDNQPTISNATVVHSTDVQPTPINALVDSRYTHPYPPAPPSESLIFSDWLLNHPSCNQNDPPIPLEVIRCLDYCLRDSS